MKKIHLQFLLAQIQGMLLMLMLIPTSLLAQDGSQASRWKLAATGMVSYNQDCTEKAVGFGAGLDVEYRLSPVVGFGLGTSLSVEGTYIRYQAHPVNGLYWETTKKINEQLSHVNVPARFYLHLKKWLHVDVGLQYSCLLSENAYRLSRSSLSVPIGISVGTKYRIGVRVQPRVAGMKSSKSRYYVESDQLSLTLSMDYK